MAVFGAFKEYCVEIMLFSLIFMNYGAADNLN